MVRTKNGVTCIGYTDLPGRCAAQSSTLFGNNVANFILSMGDSKEARFEIRHDDEAVRGALVTQDFQVMFPPPPPAAKPKPPPSAIRTTSSPRANPTNPGVARPWVHRRVRGFDG